MPGNSRSFWIPTGVVSLSLTLILLAAGETYARVQQVQQDDVERKFASAMQLHQSGDIEGAIKGYQSILTTHPERVDVRSNLGAALSRLGRYEEAIEQYKKALPLSGGNPSIRFNLALAYYKAAWFDEAAKELSTFLGTGPQGTPQMQSATLLLADCEVRLGEYKKVIELLSPLENSSGDNRTIAYLLGSALISDGQISRGQMLIDRVFRGEDTAEARLLIGSILLLADDGNGAIKELERAIQLNPKLPALRSWYGRALMRMGDAEKAKSIFKAELADNPTDFDANLYLGILLKRDRQYDDCLNYLTQAARLRPRESYARYQLASLYAATGKAKEAQPLLEGVVKEFPDFVEAHVLLASVYYRLDRKPDGDREREIVQKLNTQQQAKQPGSQPGNSKDPSKPPTEP